jgi:hypothetical protein
MCHLKALQWPQEAKKLILAALQWAQEAKDSSICDLPYSALVELVLWSCMWTCMSCSIYCYVSEPTICELM